jgi:hypothetical protein
MDLTPLIENPHLNIGGFVDDHIQRFARDVAGRINRFQFPEPNQDKGS